MPSNRRYSAEVRESTVPLYFDQREEFLSDWAAIGSIAKKLGITPKTLRKWVRRIEVDRDQCLGVAWTLDVGGNMRNRSRFCFLFDHRSLKLGVELWPVRDHHSRPIMAD